MEWKYGGIYQYHATQNQCAPVYVMAALHQNPSSIIIFDQVFCSVATTSDRNDGQVGRT
jgi:hypothetical protein